MFTTQRFQRTHTTFITGTTGFDALTDPHLFLRQFAVEFGVLHLFNAQRFLFAFQIEIVVAWPGDQLATVQIDNARRHVADKRTVMGNKDDAAGEVLQERFQPVDGFDIEVVGWLIQHQDARVTHQRTTQCRFTQPAARERRQLGIGLQTNLLQHVMDAALQLPQILMVENALQTRHLIEVFIAGIFHHHMGNGVIGFQMLSLLFNALGHEVIHRTGNIARRILLQTRHDQIGFINNAAIIQWLFAIDDFHQRGFTRTVTAHQTDAFVLFDVQFGIV